MAYTQETQETTTTNRICSYRCLDDGFIRGFESAITYICSKNKSKKILKKRNFGVESYNNRNETFTIRIQWQICGGRKKNKQT